MDKKIESIKVSIIIPIYNVEKYIDECIASVANQTHKNVEIILVNDESPDVCPEICDIWSQRDSRIKVIHKKNAGAQYARRDGLYIATGEYVMFVDGDDWLDPNTVEKCLINAINNNSDCVLFSYIKEYENESIPHKIFTNEFYYTGSDVENKIVKRLVGFDSNNMQAPENIDNLSPMCMKLYKKEIAMHGKIVSERIVGTSEDAIFNLYALSACQSVSYINECLYHYRKTNSKSITTQYKKGLPEKWDILYSIFEEYIENSNEEKEYHQAFLNRVACGMIGLGLNEICSSNSFLETNKNIKKILNRPLYKDAFKKLNIKTCPIKWKVFFILCKLNSATILHFLLSIMNYIRTL